MIYDLTDDNQLQIFFYAISDRNTLINITNHVYFNLSEPDIMQVKLQIAATKFLERTDEGLPTGDIVSLESIDQNLSQWHNRSSLLSKAISTIRLCEKMGSTTVSFWMKGTLGCRRQSCYQKVIELSYLYFLINLQYNFILVNFYLHRLRHINGSAYNVRSTQMQ